MLTPAGFIVAPRRLRVLAVVSLPIAALFAYVQQPDRALWNMHFLVLPLAAVALDRAPAIGAATIGAFAVANLRVGAQLPMARTGRLALMTSMLLAVATAAAALRGNPSRDAIVELHR